MWCQANSVKAFGERRIRRLGVVPALLALLLAGCSEGNFDDLRSYVQQVKNRQQAKVAPLPDIVPQTTFAYAAGEMRDPFVPSFVKQVVKEVAATGGPQPDLQRRREALESVPLDSLRMAGSMQRGGERVGIVKTTDGTLYPVRVGNYIGQDFGRIEQITENKIVLRELIANGMGGWEERVASLGLSE